ncbi:PQQ-dependent sugar dehydrogenase [Paenibacillus sp. J5C_2022]|uniref:PQQ-dependent sugar dehydrogenase n=1 Tax=Paenibacillus sp. J5C2022 TaxID=2977129 RepID=UPI0021CF6B00|nr:PQQ-dependent sugar dehydrogenase [Paenibacillus sp. J5C2022]MCU6711895.1 PQQ-dependent sugar dehydrogenase [Paenibacillus sp. J5C2022]
MASSRYKRLALFSGIVMLVVAIAVLAAGCRDHGGESDDSAEGVRPQSSASAGEGGKSAENVEEERAPEDEGSEATDEPYRIEAEGLMIPWSIDFHGDDIYMSEREGRVATVRNGTLVREELHLAKPVHHDGEGGLLGFLLAPDFAESRQAYAYHTYREQGQTKNRIVLLLHEEGGWQEMRALLEDIPGSLYHNGGRLAFGPDGMLYATTGDAAEKSLAQDKSSLAGKILRMLPDGGIPEDNPIAGSYVYTYGHRNPQGMAWTADGVMYSTEHGPSGSVGGHDEINLIVAGGNYGWPLLMGDRSQEGMISPVHHTGTGTIAPSGMLIDAEGSLLIAGLRGEAIYRYSPDTDTMEKLHEGVGRIRDVRLKDGRLYFITNNKDGRGFPAPGDDRVISITWP